MFTKNSRKGFTIVELVIVIAIIAILASALIPTFGGLIDSANATGDQALVRNLNTVLTVDEVTNGKDAVNRIDRAIEVAANEGYSVAKLTPTSKGNYIVFNEVDNRFALIAKDKLPTENQDDIWLIITDEDDFTPNAPYSQYMACLVEGTEFNVSAGFAAGENTGINVNYAVANPEGVEHTVTFIMNGGKLSINNPKADVHSFETKDVVDIVAVANASYHEHGTVAQSINVTTGHIVVEKDAEVAKIEVVAEATDASISIETGATVVMVDNKAADTAAVSVAAKSGANVGKVAGVTAEQVTGIPAEDIVEDLSIYEARIGTKFYERLTAALKEVKTGETVTLTKTVVRATYFAITTSGITLDLSGNVLATNQQYVIITSKAHDVVIKNGQIQLLQNESIQEQAYAIYSQGGSITVEDVDIYLAVPAANVYNIGIGATSFSAFPGYETVSTTCNNVLIKTMPDSTGAGLTVGMYTQGGGTADSTKMYINDCYVDVTGFAACGNGAVHGTHFDINDSELHSAAWGIYHPQDGTLVINNSKIIGDKTGIEIRAGHLEINNSTIEGNGDPFATEENGSGATIIGTAIAVSQHTTEKPIIVTINGGTIKGTLYSVYETDTVASDEPSKGVSITINSGTFEGEIKSENNKITDNR